MKYAKVVSGTFVDRPNRFIAHVEVEGVYETVHVKNTGRCKELLLPGVTVILEDFRNRPDAAVRKTKFDLIAVYKEILQENPLYHVAEQCNDGNRRILINMDSQAPNKVVHEWLISRKGKDAYSLVKPEFTFGKSRVDFYMERNDSGDMVAQKYLMEVKGCTLERNGQGFFPDAPTERGVKHLHELASAVSQGYKAFLAFVIQVPGVSTVMPNVETHAEFGEALKQAIEAGVEVMYLKCRVTPDQLEIVSESSTSI